MELAREPIPDTTDTAHGADHARTRVARFIAGQAILLGVLADATLRDAPWGIGWTTWLAAAVATACLVLVRRGTPLRSETGAWLAAAVLCAAAFAWRDADMVQLLNVFATLTALALAAMCIAGAPRASILAARVRDLVAAWWYAGIDALVGAPILWIREARIPGLLSRSAAARMPLLRAVVFTLPVVAVFAALLSQADPVFASLFSLPKLRIDTLVSHLAVFGGAAWIWSGWMRAAVVDGTGRRAPGDELPFRLGAPEVGALLGALNALFAVFVALQARWLFGGAEVVRRTMGLSVAEYARRGFFELVWVAALVIPVVLLTRAAAGRAESALRLHRRLALPLLALLGAIMLSAAIRLRLYVANYGLTTDRLYALLFICWLAVVVVCMVPTVMRGWGRPFATMVVSSAYLALLAVNVMNPEAIVARVDLRRMGTATGVDYGYLATLSGDATPAVATALSVAAPSAPACAAATALRARWSAAAGEPTQWNHAKANARRVVLETLTPHSLRRLCVSSATSPSESSSP